jgi:GMP synthase (glutamine-hydrolysing)
MTSTALPVLILHTGDPDEPIKRHHGGYDELLRRAAGLELHEVRTVSVHRGEQIDAPANYRAALITGSPAMVTDRAPWSEAAAEWLRGAVKAGLPIFGVCYGHQLLSHALGGEVGYLPTSELGTQEVERVGDDHDALAATLPARFNAQMLHAQTVLQPPPGAVVLARSEQDPHQLLRLAPNVYSSQFHPEFSRDFMREHFRHHAAYYADKGHDAAALAESTASTPDASGLLQRFLEMVTRRYA